MHLSRFFARPQTVFALVLFGLLPLAWKASEAAPKQGAAHSALRAHFALRPHGTLHPHSAAGPPPTAVPLYTFTGQPDGRRAEARLIQAGDGNFYGVTEGGGNADVGEAFRMTPDGKVTQLASFGRDTTDGQYPAGPLVEGLNADGTPNGVFFGTTVQGGDSGKGTIYLLAPDAGSATGYFISYLHSFTGLNSSTGSTDGGQPQGGLTLGRKPDGTPDGYLYGITSGGGNNGRGVVFRMTTNGFVESVLHAFPTTPLGGINQGGALPQGALVQGHDASGWGKLFGITSSGGADGQGTVFSITPAGQLVTLHEFLMTTDGGFPVSGLTQGADGALYGTTLDGGGVAVGTIYRVAPDSKSSTGFTYSQIVSLNFDNAGPTDSLIQASDGKLYGTGSFGGPEYGGSVFSVGADTSSTTGYSATAVYTFTDSKTHGSYLRAGVTQGTDGDLYGVTSAGGSAAAGTIFRLNVGAPPTLKAPAPTITSAEYIVASDGSTQLVFIQGDHFVKGASVTVDGAPAQSVNFTDAQNIGDVLGHLLSAGTHTVVVTNPDGQSASATLTTLDAPVVKGATALTDANGNVFLLVTGRNFGTPGYNGNGDPAGTVVDVSDSSGSPIKAATVLIPASTPAQPGGPQQVIAALDTTGAAPGPFTVTITNFDNQSSQSQTFEVYPFDQTEYAISLDPSLFLQAYQLYIQSKGTPAPGPTSDALKGQGKSGRTSLASGAPQINPPIGYQVNPNGTATLTINGTNFVRGGKLSISNTFTGTTLDSTLQGSGQVGTQLIVIASPALPAGDHTVTVTNPDGRVSAGVVSVFPSSPTQVVLGALSFGVPVPSIAITADGIATAATGLLSQDGAGLLSQDGGGVISNDGGSLISQDGGGIREPRTRSSRAAAATNSVAVTGLVADIASDAGHTGSLGLTPQFGASRPAGLKAHALPNAPLTFLLTKHDAGPARGKGSTDLTVSLNYADGTSALLLDLRVAPGQPDVVVYQAPGVTLKPRGTTPAPQISSLTPTLTALNPTTAKAGSPDLTLAVTGTLFTAGTVVNWNGTPLATTVVSGTQATATVPAALLSAAGTAQVTVTNPAPGGGASALLPFAVTPATPLHTFPAGLKMLSVPEDYARVGLGGALSDSSHTLMVWNPVTSAYETRTDLHPGTGYWVRLSKATDLYDSGTPPTGTPFPIALQAGWNMIGDPFPSAVSFASVQVQDVIGTQGTFQQAVSGGVLSGTLYAYPAGSTQYQSVGAGGSLTPFTGYWVYAFRACTLLVPAH
jgi:uncharacterized repeat protein (TIGR03803 family)